MNAVAAPLNGATRHYALPAHPTRMEAALLWGAALVARRVHDRILRRAVRGEDAERLARAQRAQTLAEAHLRGLLR